MTRRQISRVLYMLLFAVLTAPAAAQTPVYRCGPNGNEYSSTPCPGGKAVDAADPRSAEQRRQTQDAARRDAEAADKLAAERRQREAARKPTAGSLSAAAPAPAKAASKPQAKKPKKRKANANVDPNLTPPVRVPGPAR